MGNDNVNHPDHYTFGDIEVINYIRDKLTSEEFIGYCIGNTLKYVSRWRHKGGIEDLKKAQVYLGWAIEQGAEQTLVDELCEIARKSNMIMPIDKAKNTAYLWTEDSQNLQVR